MVSRTGDRVCLLRHRALDRWLQPGGHSEPEDGGRLLDTALREAREETGLTLTLHPRAPQPFEVAFFDWDAAKALASDESLRRMLRKARRLQ